MSLESSLPPSEDSPQHQCFATKSTLYEQRPWTHVQKRRAIMAEHPTPGPGSMSMPYYIARHVHKGLSYEKLAKTTIKWSTQKFQGPECRPNRDPSTYPVGPASHTISGLNVKGGKVSTPAFTIRMRLKQRDLEGLPGPSSYNINAKPILERPPSYSFRRVLTNTPKFVTPAPNEYTLPTILGHHHTPASYTLSNRLHNKPPVVTPGPDAYADTDTESYLPSAPAFSLRERETEKRQENTPGPNAYCPEKVILTKRFAPRPSLGVKHSPFLGKWNPRIVGSTCQ